MEILIDSFAAAARFACIVPPFSLKKGAGFLKKGVIAPLLRKKGAHCPPFKEKGVPGNILITTECSVGIRVVNTKKYQPILTEKYQFGIQL